MGRTLRQHEAWPSVPLNILEMKQQGSPPGAQPPPRKEDPLTRGSGPPKGLLAHPRAGGLVVDVEVASSVPQQLCGLPENIPTRQGRSKRTASSSLPQSRSSSSPPQLKRAAR